MSCVTQELHARNLHLGHGNSEKTTRKVRIVRHATYYSQYKEASALHRLQCRKWQPAKSRHCFTYKQWGWGLPPPRDQGSFPADESRTGFLASAGEDWTSRVLELSKEILSMGMAKGADSVHGSNGQAQPRELFIHYPPWGC